MVLAAGSLGVSALVCLLNNGEGGRRETTANLMGPFWREDAPPGRRRIDRALADAGRPHVRHGLGARRAGGRWSRGRVDVWQASGEGYYENQDPGQADMNLRGTFRTDATAASLSHRQARRLSDPGQRAGRALLRAQGRHNLRPAHIHFLIRKPGYKTQFSQLYSSDDPHLETDVQFGVTRGLVGDYVLHEAASRPPPPTCRAVVLARTSLRHRAGRRRAAAAADHRQGQRRAAAARGAATTLRAVSAGWRSKSPCA